MKRENAERLAASGEEVTLEQAKAVIQEFLTQLARCQVCDNSGKFTFGHETTIAQDVKRFGGYLSEERTVSEGMTSACPACGDGSGDPVFVKWHCFRGDAENFCKSSKSAGNGDEKEHADCEPVLLLPIKKTK